MTTRTFNPIILTIILSLSAQAASKPNIILFMADDMGMGDTSAYQNFTGNADNPNDYLVAVCKGGFQPEHHPLHGG